MNPGLDTARRRKMALQAYHDRGPSANVESWRSEHLHLPYTMKGTLQAGGSRASMPQHAMAIEPRAHS